MVLKKDFTDWQSRYSSKTIAVITGEEKNIGIWVLIGDTTINETVMITIVKGSTAVFQKQFLAGGFKNDVIYFNDPVQKWENAQYSLTVQTPTERKTFTIPVTVKETEIQDSTPPVNPLEDAAKAIKAGKLSDAEIILNTMPRDRDYFVVLAALGNAYLERYDFDNAERIFALAVKDPDTATITQPILDELKNKSQLKENAVNTHIKRYYTVKKDIAEGKRDTVESALAADRYLQALFSEDLKKMTDTAKKPFPKWLLFLVIAGILTAAGFSVKRMFFKNHLKRALDAFQNKNYQSAADHFEKYITNSRSEIDISVYRRLAETYMKLELLDKALDIYKKCDAIVRTQK